MAAPTGGTLEPFQTVALRNHRNESPFANWGHRPNPMLQARPKMQNLRLPLRIACVRAPQHAETPHPIGLLRARRERPRRHAAEERDALAACQSITSSARASMVSGTVRPRVLAVL